MITSPEPCFIFTEIVNCGKIGRIALDSFHKYHTHIVHVYGTKEDFAHLIPHKNNVLIEVPGEVIKGYERGHIGTALLWEQVIKNSPHDRIIHFDSDVIFRANVLDDMLTHANDYDLIGPIRNYHQNPHGRSDISHLTDICQTNCTLFKRSLISSKYLNGKQPFPSLQTLIHQSPIQWARQLKWWIMHKFQSGYTLSTFARMIHGTYNPFSFPTIDFFDPVMFDMVKNGAKILHLNPDEVGGWDAHGSRDTAFKEINNFPTSYKLDFGSKLVHFSCVGSGMNFYQHPERKAHVGSAYVNASLDRYALFCRIFYNEILPDISVDQYGAILALKEWY